MTSNLPLATFAALFEQAWRSGRPDVRLIDLVSPALERYVRKRLRPYTPRFRDLDEIIEHAFTGLFREAHRGHAWDSPESLWAALVRRVDLETRDANREAGRSEHTLYCRAQPLLVATEQELVLAKPGPPELAQHHELRSWVLARLSRRQRRVLTLHLEGCTLVESARQARCSVSTVRRELRAILEKLRRWGLDSS